MYTYIYIYIYTYTHTYIRRCLPGSSPAVPAPPFIKRNLIPTLKYMTQHVASSLVFHRLLCQP